MLLHPSFQLWVIEATAIQGRCRCIGRDRRGVILVRSTAGEQSCKKQRPNCMGFHGNSESQGFEKQTQAGKQPRRNRS